MMRDPVCGMLIDEKATSSHSEYKGRRFSFCCGDCRRAFDNEPEKFASRLMDKEREVEKRK